MKQLPSTSSTISAPASDPADFPIPPSAPPEDPPTYASSDLDLIMDAAGDMTDNQLAERLNRPFDIRQPSRIVELVLTKDVDGARHWFGALRRLRAQGRLKNELAQLLSGQGTAPLSTQPLQQALLTHGPCDCIRDYWYNHGDVTREEQWLTKVEADALLLSRTSALRDAVHAGCELAPFKAFVTALLPGLQTGHVSPADFVTFVHGGPGAGNVLDAALMHEDPRVLDVFLELATTAHCRTTKAAKAPGKRLLHVFPVTDAQFERILLPSTTGQADSLLRRLVALDAAPQLQVYLKRLMDGCAYHGLPTKLLVKALGDCLPQGRELKDLAIDLPRVHDVLAIAVRDAVRAGLLAPFEGARFQYNVEMVDFDDPARAAAHERDTPARSRMDRGTQTESRRRRGGGLLACFGSGRRPRMLNPDGDASRAGASSMPDHRGTSHNSPVPAPRWPAAR